ncbi:MAG: cysteine--tRNA ligase, partial [Ilumatobacteraceae bacterium]|nr:cysteine--tRNA ligase [Ilumatobacteraceae bacterium]
MSMRLYDTARRDIVPFTPNELVLMYTCGITPYDATHLGHASTFLFYDILQRRLIDLGHTVRCVRNVTDVDDPLFVKARELGVHYLDLAAGEEARFNRDMEALEMLPAYSTPRASS